MEVNKVGIGSIGIPSLILIIIIALIVFGPSKLPDIGKAAGQTLREFKNATSDLMSDSNKDDSIEKEDHGDSLDGK